MALFDFFCKAAMCIFMLVFAAGLGAMLKGGTNVLRIGVVSNTNVKLKN